MFSAKGSEGNFLQEFLSLQKNLRPANVGTQLSSRLCTYRKVCKWTFFKKTQATLTGAFSPDVQKKVQLVHLYKGPAVIHSTE
jgi:hypothetical protein